MYGQKLACGQLKVHVSYWKDDFRKMSNHPRTASN
ncbi:hypothetical protein T03_2967 [Trichinella britovi]|uniref:Uncharacterized protein n=1 Tax=Trichinella britovi TaxID=45882 RepID=A0A0V1AM80_TRIBR|nr:hypothetical protein T03_2967 [Trichinella britovi]